MEIVVFRTPENWQNGSKDYPGDLHDDAARRDSCRGREIECLLDERWQIQMGLNDKTIDEYADCASWAESTCFNCGEWFTPTDKGLRLFELYDLAHHLHHGVDHHEFKKMLRRVRRRVRRAFSRGVLDFRLKKPVCEKCLSTGYLSEVVDAGMGAIRNGGLDWDGTDAERLEKLESSWS